MTQNELTEDAVMRADHARRRAMIDADAGKLATLLADGLIWTHSSGQVDDKAAVLAKIESGAVVYEALDVDAVQVRTLPGALVLQGTLLGRVRKDGAARELRNRFLSVWRHGAGGPELLAWQSTGF